jgi:uncharacterized protein YecT (DUF1311 family)
MIISHAKLIRKLNDGFNKFDRKLNKKYKKLLHFLSIKSK